MPPGELLKDLRLPDRSGISTVGDMARVLQEDEWEIRRKNSDLAALRSFYARVKK